MGARHSYIFCFLILMLANGYAELYAQSGRLAFESYTLEDGLQNNVIQQCFQDSKGYMWFATSHGVSRFDGYQFTSFRNDPSNKKTISGILARVIYEDKAKNLWFGTESGGLNKFNWQKETFEHILPKDSVTGIGTSVKTIAEDKVGSLWMGTNIGIKVYRPKHGNVKWFKYRPNSVYSPSDSYVRVLQFDNQGKLWVGTNKGLDILNPKTGEFQRINKINGALGDEIWEIYKDPKGILWVGTYNNGLFRVDPKTLQITRINLGTNRPWAKAIKSVMMDKNGMYWIGSRAGLFIYNSRTGIAQRFGNEESDPRSLVHNSILNIYQDRADNIWIGTRGGISVMSPSLQIFKHYKASGKPNTKYLNHNEVYTVLANSSGSRVFVGTGEGGLNILDRETDSFSYLTHIPNNLNSIAGNGVKSLLLPTKNKLWIGTYKEGISIYDLDKKNFEHFKHSGDDNSLSDNTVWAMHLDKEKRIWVGTDAGLDLYRPKDRKFISQLSTERQIAWISEDSKGRLWLGLQSQTALFVPGKGIIKIIKEQGSCFYEDSKSRYWLATKSNGLVLLDQNLNPVKYYQEKNGLPNNQVFQILEDEHKRLWLSTANGLTVFNPETEVFTNFDKRDGLQSKQFHYGAAFKLPTGELIFGGINGFNIFNPAKVVRGRYQPPIVLTDFKIFNKTVKQGDAFDVLNTSLPELKRVNIPYSYNFITFEFAVLNYLRPEKNQYKFRLAGFDRNWNEAASTPTATYTNLDPGHYVFEVVTANTDQIGTDKVLQLEVNILPPFWQTWWFRLLAFLLAANLTYVIFRFLINREKIKQQLNLERNKIKHLNEMNDSKLHFFTNISHEIKTPLTLIIGPLERLMNSEIPPNLIKNQLELMYRNANSLLKLVNQLLDFRKLETGNLKLEPRKGDLIIFIKNIIHSFSPVAEEKDIQLTFKAFSENLMTYFDSEKLEKILNNLIANALKFTDRGGTVSVYIAIGIEENSEGSEQYLEIIIKDNGKGISPQNLKRIFNRFFQVSENDNHGGTGIGLALTQELVKLHSGTIMVESEPGKGTKFIVRLPMIAPEEKTYLKNIDAKKPVDINKDDLLNERILLVVEDNADVRQFIRENFETQFHVVEAADGKEGLVLAKQLLPDIILSDVMMPYFDGNELCKKLKEDTHTSHIPVLLLTALSSKRHIIEGLSSGADDYITKPFDVSILQNKIENLLSLRNSMRQKYESQIVISPQNIEICSPDELFIRKAITVVEDYIADPNLDIETFTNQMAVSRMQMYRKLDALTGMTVKKFIRDIRLKRAIQLLDQKKLNVSEVAYAVGFKDLSHFRKCFREKFGINATTYLKKLDVIEE